MEIEASLGEDIPAFELDIVRFGGRDRIQEMLINRRGVKLAIGGDPGDREGLQNLHQAADMVGVRMGGDHQVDALDAKFFEVWDDAGIRVAPVDENGLAGGGLDEDGVALADVDEADVEGTGFGRRGRRSKDGRLREGRGTGDGRRGKGWGTGDGGRGEGRGTGDGRRGR